MANTPDDLLPTRWSLVERLKNLDDQASWQDFFDLYWKLIYGVAIKAGLNDTEAQEAVQETVISVVKKIPRFQADPDAGSFKGWLLQLTRRRIVDQFRKRPPPGRIQSPRLRSNTSARTATVERVPEPHPAGLDRVWEEEWQKHLLEAALDRVRKRVNPKHYQIFHWLVIKELPPEQVAQTLRIKVDNVYLAKHRVAAALKQEVDWLEQHCIPRPAAGR